MATPNFKISKPHSFLVAFFHFRYLKSLLKPVFLWVLGIFYLLLFQVFFPRNFSSVVREGSVGGVLAVELHHLFCVDLCSAGSHAVSGVTPDALQWLPSLAVACRSLPRLAAAIQNEAMRNRLDVRIACPIG